MKVLFFSHQAKFIYGGEIVTLAFMEQLRSRGVDVHFASPAGPYFERAKTIAACHEVPSMQFSRRFRQLPATGLALARTHRALKRILEENDIPVVHATSLKAMVYCWGLKKRQRVIWHHHDILPETLANGLWLRAIGKRANLVLTPSDAARDALLRAGLPFELCHTLKNGFRLDQWVVRPVRTSAARLRVLLVGELSWRKGFDRLPGILRSLREMGGAEGVDFQVVGEAVSDPAYAVGLRQSLKGEAVQFLGRREDLKALYRDADLLLVLSRQDPLPTVIIEASLSGLPSIGTQVGGIPEMILPGKTGYLADSDEEIAESIIRARELTTWEGLSRGARFFAEKNHDLQRLTGELQSFYGRLLG